MIALADGVMPLVDRMRALLLALSVVCVDKTPVKLLVPGAGKAFTAYLWTMVGDRSHPYKRFTSRRAGAAPVRRSSWPVTVACWFRMPMLVTSRCNRSGRMISAGHAAMRMLGGSLKNFIFLARPGRRRGPSTISMNDSISKRRCARRPMRSVTGCVNGSRG